MEESSFDEMKISNLTVDELKQIVKQVVSEELSKINLTYPATPSIPWQIPFQVGDTPPVTTNNDKIVQWTVDTHTKPFNNN